MDKNLLVIALIVLVFGLAVWNLSVPYGGYVLVGGDSMHPTIPEGCSIVYAESWDGESELNGSIAAFEPTHLDPQEFEFDEGVSVDSVDWLAHSVVAEYKEFDIESSSYSINEDGLLVSEEDDLKMGTPQTYDDAKDLEGEHIVVLKGENNAQIDRELVSAENVLGTLDEQRQIQIMDLDEWPCSAAD